ncbi:SPASM domain-containing protein, partial [Patescibacteria group bacterium]|nr:SPASM domain-containing protein [Patescibacteria group bacterium]
CNAKCVVCPHLQASQELPSGLMDMGLFCRIIDQIDPSWGCRIIPYLNSEPMLDPLIISRLRYINGRLENPEVELSTNMSALTSQRQAAMTGIRIRDLRLSIFGFTENTHKRLMPGLHWATVKENLDHLVMNRALCNFIDQIGIVMIDHPLVTADDLELAQKYCTDHSLVFNHWGFLDRAGNVELYSNGVHRPVVVGCEQNRPLERMHITFTGKVILCCQDWRWRNVVGNTKHQSLLEIWNSNVYQHYRESIYAGKGNQPEICTRCKLSVLSS